MSGDEFLLDFCIWAARGVIAWGAATILFTLLVLMLTPAGMPPDYGPAALGAKLVSVAEFIACAIAWVYEEDPAE